MPTPTWTTPKSKAGGISSLPHLLCSHREVGTFVVMFVETVSVNRTVGDAMFVYACRLCECTLCCECCISHSRLVGSMSSASSRS